MKAKVKLTYVVETTVETPDECELWQCMGIQIPFTSLECSEQIISLLPDDAPVNIVIGGGQ